MDDNSHKMHFPLSSVCGLVLISIHSHSLHVSYQKSYARGSMRSFKAMLA